MNLWIYEFIGPKLKQFIRSTGIDGYEHSNGSVYVTKSDYKVLCDIGWDTNDASSDVFLLDNHEINKLFYELDHNGNDDAISYLLDGQKVKLYVCCIPECLQNKYAENMPYSEQKAVFANVCSEIARSVPSWVAVCPVFDSDKWDYVMGLSNYFSGTDYISVCYLERLNSDTILKVAINWCDKVQEIYINALNNELKHWTF